ncbi:MAG: oxidoreductase, short chain dehydrogenase/reductase family [Cyanobacteria bacterium RYN_339]|nr:oxidoreductase, short chain dehydrogenase/reductase family [Cyanobacteria bacterium RYN_339]
MPKTVLITGASAGLGRSVAERFQREGWNVVATMRRPAEEQTLTQLDRVACLALDVTDEASVQAAVAEAIARFGQLDVVINNAGYGLSGVFESLSPDQIRRQFDTNVFGVMAVTRAVLPHFRERRAGTIVNVASMGGRLTLPLYSPYHATKWAVEGFTESLRYELAQLGIRVKLVEPGVIRTDFYGRSGDTGDDEGVPAAYQAYARRVRQNLSPDEKSGASAEEVAATVWRAATDGRNRLRYVVGRDARQLLLLRRLLPDFLFFKVVGSVAEAGVPPA